MLALRGVARTPMGFFDTYRGWCKTHPRTMNFYMVNLGFVAMFIVGKGSEKINFRGRANTYEKSRRLRRMFMPYSLVGY